MMDAISREMGFRYFALAHHDNSSSVGAKLVRLFKYPDVVTDRLVEQGLYRRDPVVRACLHAYTAFLWSDLPDILTLDRGDRESLAFGSREGLNEGITVPFVHLGDAVGSCTFAGTNRAERSSIYLGAAQMIGVFAFQAARRLVGAARPVPRSPRLHPRPRDCVVLAGQGLSNKEIARALALTPRTVDGYLTEARRLFGVHDRTELVITAVLAGEVGLDELRRRQPE
jgi:DNA-binding CsgD family transcriptional regulator